MSVGIMLGLTQAALLTIFEEISSAVRHRGGEKQTPAPDWILIHELRITRRALYHCVTTAAKSQNMHELVS